MNKYFLVLALILTSMSTVFADVQPSEENESEVVCLAYIPMLDLDGAQSYTGVLTSIINWSVNYSDDDTYELAPKEEIQSLFAEALAANTNILLDDAIAIRDAYFRRLAQYEIINTSAITSVKIADVRYTENASIEGAQYELTFGVTSAVENAPEGSGVYAMSTYEITVGLTYVFDTCSGKGYVPGPTGVKAIKDVAGNVIMNVKVVK